ncbi:hypothetical protein NLJ89_g11097 [Agrocybe chaxingu]|uniref:MYND-type domain-containing protein n=1 Tax=Agrocybe chaxingu TaxID=84603 RepID=A0A9W8MQA5_9AGAR|nr:hypothetical protein NLJ89_g11097 [Agrocybe chaxingu]
MQLIYILVLLTALMGAWYGYRLVQYKRQVGGCRRPPYRSLAPPWRPPPPPLATAIAGAVRAYVPPASLSSLAANPRETGEAVRVLLGEDLKVDHPALAELPGDSEGMQDGKGTAVKPSDHCSPLQPPSLLFFSSARRGIALSTLPLSRRHRLSLNTLAPTLLSSHHHLALAPHLTLSHNATTAIDTGGDGGRRPDIIARTTKIWKGEADINGKWDDESRGGGQEEEYKLARFIRHKISCLYDFGDQWFFKIEIQKIYPLEESTGAIEIIDGKGMCPGENLHRSFRYNNFLKEYDEASYAEKPPMNALQKPSVDPARCIAESMNRKWLKKGQSIVKTHEDSFGHWHETNSSTKDRQREAVCASCGKPAAPDVQLKQCSGCRQVLYCSPEHQKAHWKTLHKKQCTRQYLS